MEKSKFDTRIKVAQFSMLILNLRSKLVKNSDVTTDSDEKVDNLVTRVEIFLSVADPRDQRVDG